jgi:hypothetical protein
VTAPPKDAQWHDIPAGTRPSTCNGKQKGGVCEATIYWITSKRGRPLPVDCAIDGGLPPSAAIDPHQLSMLEDGETPHDGRGVSHFQTCPDARRFD